MSGLKKLALKTEELLNKWTFESTQRGGLSESEIPTSSDFRCRRVWNQAYFWDVFPQFPYNVVRKRTLATLIVSSWHYQPNLYVAAESRKVKLTLKKSKINYLCKRLAPIEAALNFLETQSEKHSIRSNGSSLFSLFGKQSASWTGCLLNKSI